MNKNDKFKPLYLGVAYYPEDWDESEMAYDIEMMKKAGINVARIGEFAWSKMEKREGEFTFEWLHKVVDALGEAGIATIMCTPSATPPRWLSLMHPDVMMEKENGEVKNHGGRRHCCSNNPHYIKYSLRIAEEMAKEFADDKNIIGWQIDNEIHNSANGCFCKECQKKFKKHLADKFGSIENLNARWNLGCWSQEYLSFDDIPAPRNTWVNPHHITEWNLFQSASHIEFIGMQADIIHKYVKVPVGTDMMPRGEESYQDMHKKLDLVQYNHYNTAENLWEAGFWFDFIRPVLDAPFWNTETSTCWNGHHRISQTVKPEGFCFVNSWLPIALGGEANLYWLWRTHWGGHELMHGSVLDASGRPMHVFGEVQRVAETYKKASDFINGTKVETPVAMHFTSLTRNMEFGQKVFDGFDYRKLLMNNFYRPITDLGIRPDVIDSEASLDKYKVLFTNLVFTLEDRGMGERIREWVENGGVWVVGPLTDVRNCDGAKFKHRPYGMLEEMTGIKWDFSAPDQNGDIKCTYADGRAFEGTRWFELSEPDGDTLASVTEAPHSALLGKSVLAKKKVGKGTVYVLGSIPTYEAMKDIIIPEVMSKVGISHFASEGVVVVDRKGSEYEGKIIVDVMGKGGEYRIPYNARDILTDTQYNSGDLLEIKPYEVYVLEKL